MDGNKRKGLIWAGESTVICYLLAHGYHFFHNMFAGDSLGLIYQKDYYTFEIGLGRCFNPLWVFLRGVMLTPWLISALAIFWLALSVFFIADLFKLKTKTAYFFTAAALTMNVVIVSLYTAFIPWIDLYTLALFLNILGIWFMEKRKPLFWGCGAICIAVGLGTYQAYITAAVTLVMILIMIGLSDNQSFRETGKKLVQYITGVLAGGIVYFIIWKAVQAKCHIETYEGYNGLAGMTDYSGVSIWKLLGTTYQKVFDYFWNPSVFVSLYFGGRSLTPLWFMLYRILNCLAVISLIALLIKRNLDSKTGILSRVLQFILLIIFPLGMNSVCILSKGMEHTLMQYAFVLLYIFVIKMFHDFFKKSQKTSVSVYAKMAVITCFGIICWINVVLSNQIYLKLRLEEEAALSMMTRLVNDVENFDGYEPGRTQVAFTGTWLTSPYIVEPEGFDELSVYMLGKTLFVYPDAEIHFLHYYLNSNMLVTEINADQEEIKNMPTYPQKGSIRFVGETLVVKMSDRY